MSIYACASYTRTFLLQSFHRKYFCQSFYENHLKISSKVLNINWGQSAITEVTLLHVLCKPLQSQQEVFSFPTVFLKGAKFTKVMYSSLLLQRNQRIIWASRTMYPKDRTYHRTLLPAEYTKLPWTELPIWVLRCYVWWSWMYNLMMWWLHVLCSTASCFLEKQHYHTSI